MFFTIPTLLTWTRIVAIPLIVGVFYLGLPTPVQNLVATVLFVAFALTDWLDGFLARRLNQTSAFGAFLDPVADKLAVTVALFLIVQWHHTVPIALLSAVIVGREITISALREWMAQVGAHGLVKVAGLGKLKTIVQMTAISCLIFREPLLGLPIFLIGVAVFLTEQASPRIARPIGFLVELLAAIPSVTNGIGGRLGFQKLLPGRARRAKRKEV